MKKKPSENMARIYLQAAYGDRESVKRLLENEGLLDDTGRRTAERPLSPFHLLRKGFEEPQGDEK